VLSRTPTPHPLLMAKLKKAATKVRGLPVNPLPSAARYRL